MTALTSSRFTPTVRAAVVVLVTLLVVTAGIVAGRTLLATSDAAANRRVPQSAAMELALGIRVSRIAVVADGGLLTLSYVVLDAEKAQRFQADKANPPVLSSESRELRTKRVSMMKQGHTLRAGQTYYLVYENTRGALRSGESASVNAAGLHLAHVPVL